MKLLLRFSLCLCLINKIFTGSIVFSNEIFNQTFEDAFIGIVAKQPDDIIVYNAMIDDVRKYVEGDTSIDISNYDGFKFYLYKIQTKCSISRLLRRNCIKNFLLFRVNARDLIDLFNLQTAVSLIDVFIEFDSSKALLYSLYFHYLKYILTFDLETLVWHQGIEVEYTELFKGVPRDRNRWHNLILPPGSRPNSQPVDLCISIQTPNLFVCLNKRITFYKVNADSNQPREQADFPDIIIKLFMEIEFDYIDPNGDLNDLNNIRFSTIHPLGVDINIPGGIVCKTSELLDIIPTQTTTNTTTHTTTKTETHTENSSHSHHTHSNSSSHGKSDKSDSDSSGRGHKSKHDSSGSGKGKSKKKKKKKKKKRSKKERKARFIKKLFERIKTKKERLKQREMELEEDAEFFEIELLEIDINALIECPEDEFIKYSVIFRNTSNSGRGGKSSSRSHSSSRSSHSH